MIQKIGLLTGGGDCPGLNAVIRTVTLCAERRHIEVVGFLDGYIGLVENRTIQLKGEQVSELLAIGGTVLGTSNKSDPKHYISAQNSDGTPIFHDRTLDCISTVKRHALDGLLIVGGDGTMAAAAHLHAMGIPCIGIPKTIDNDIPSTDITFGFLTAVAIATESIDRVKTTAASHARVMVVEVMGRNAGWIALYSGIAGGADIILLPEAPFNLEKLSKAVSRYTSGSKRHCIIVVSEGSFVEGGSQVISKLDPTSPDPVRLGGVSKFVAEELEKRTNIESRYVVLGHVQRGGGPTAPDRIVATTLAFQAMELLAEEKFGRIVVIQNGKPGHVALEEIAGQQKKVPLNHPMITCAKAIGVSFGE